MFYFLGWLAVTVWHASFFIRFKYLLFLTHWAFIVWNVYLVTSAATSIMALWREASPSANAISKLEDGAAHSASCCGGSHFNTGNSTSDTSRAVGNSKAASLSWYYKLQWMTFLIGSEYAIAISILYWSMFYDPNSEHNYFSLDSLNLHLINGIAAVLDLWLSGMPVSMYHAIYSISFGLVYILFTAFYFLAEGTDPDGNRFIYQFLDYSSYPWAALGLAVLLTVLFIGIIHFLLFILRVFRHRLCQCTQGSLPCQCTQGSMPCHYTA